MVFLFGRDGLKTSIKLPVCEDGLSLPAWSPVLQLQRERCDPSLCPVFVPNAGTGHGHQEKGQSQSGRLSDGTAAAGQA